MNDNQEIKSKHFTQLPNGVIVEWKVDTHGFTKEILEGYPANGGVFTAPMNIFRAILVQVGERCAEINDPVLNALMCRLAIYAESAPDDKENYNDDLVTQTLTHPDYLEWRKTH